MTKIKRMWLSLAMAVLLLPLAAAPTMALAFVVLQDNFDSEHGGTGVVNYSGFANWSVSNGTVDLIGNGYFDFLPGNGLYVDMDGSTGNAGMMSHTFVLTPGTYALEFELAGNRRNGAAEMVTVKVGVGTLLSENFSLAQDAPFTQYTRTFEVASNTTAALSFEGLGGDNIGMLLDDVKLTKLPEPSTVLLLGLSLLGVAGLRSRFRM
jgi:hypothetical protein